MKKILLSASAAALLLGSCSKDDAELAPTVNAGKTAFVAGMTIGNDNDTRVHLEDGDYLWDAGDMVGVSTGKNAENIPFVSKLGGTSAAFEAVEEDLSYLGKGTYYMVYPYNNATTFEEKDEVVKVAMTIPAVQRYRNNSFATMTAPAVAVVKDYNEGAQITFQPVASYIRVKVNGAGMLKSLKLEIKDQQSQSLNLAGTDLVNLSGDSYSLKIGDNASVKESAVTIDFGAGGLELEYSEAKNLMFVIPADIDLGNTDITLTGNIDGEDEEQPYTSPSSEFITKANEITPFNKTVTFGLEGKTIIADAEDLLRYVYAINQGVANAKADENLKDLVNNDDTFKTALIINDINCKDIDDKYISAVPANMEKAYNWYIKTNQVATDGDKAIGSFTFPSGVAYSIVGGLNDASTITNMCVTTAGEGIFNNNDATIKNIVFDNASVYVGSETLTEESCAKFLANENVATLEDVTIKGGEVVALDETTFGKAALFGSVMASKLSENVELVAKYPLYGADFVLVAESLAIDEDVDLTAYVDEEFNPKFGKIVGSTPGAKITIKNKEKEQVEASIMDIIDLEETTADKYFSVMMENGSVVTSLWTGVTLKAAAKSEIRTAEELTAVVAYAKTKALTIAFKNNIDLRGLNWIGVSTAAKNKITVDGNRFSLSNVKMANYTEKEGVKTVLTGWGAADKYVSVFGQQANITSLNVYGLNIDIIGVEKATKSVYVSGLAYRGVANSVVLAGAEDGKSAEINVADDVELGGKIGAVMAINDGDSRGNTVSATINGEATSEAFAE